MDDYTEHREQNLQFSIFFSKLYNFIKFIVFDNG